MVVRLEVSYDGTDFKGYQIQTSDPTVQGLIENAISKVYNQTIKTFTSGRTDTGVHAIMQVISFKTDKNIPEDGLKKALNSLLPPQIRVNKVKYENKSFHARFSAKSREYMYVIYNNDDVCPPFFYRYVWHVRGKIKIRKLKKTLKYLKGEHDFSSFSERTEKDNHVRKIISIKVKKKGKFIYIFIKGNAFLRRMVRVIIGTCVGIAKSNDFQPEFIKDILKAKNRGKNPFPTAPPNGLYLYKIEF
ncbi:MAG TPA: tRNA pseudouridine(38-40) synthase TruA [Spirochaetota bacterium]|nr:tRNA pseudouridine(38-40) synthase TruA [Spirochaetota bacterium]HOM37902.1 tRNA pseudouridine(38-40) synthase TruA [Spirochaetota bacterium]HPQ48706.1 tRNA pseudouridine(38-40) synthase TruA [Spirochaetota bacterium]